MTDDKRETNVSEAQVRRVFSLAPADMAGCTHLNKTPDYAADLFDRWLKAHDDALRERLAQEVEVDFAKWPRGDDGYYIGRSDGYQHAAHIVRGGGL